MSYQINGSDIINNDNYAKFNILNLSSYTNVSRPAGTNVGDIIFNEDENSLQMWTGSEWSNFGRQVLPRVAAITITMWGAGGGGVRFPGGEPTWGIRAPGGAGGHVQAYLTGIESGDTLTIYVGSGGAGPGPGGSNAPNGGHPGSGGKGGPGNGGGSGGGMTSIYLNGDYNTGTRLLIAGGGGAASYESAASYPSGFKGGPGPSGSGGTQTGGGSKGNPGPYPPGSNGAQFTGGNGAQPGNAKSGGGGAGWYGGGGGGADTGAATGGGGGGGSNYHNPAYFVLTDPNTNLEALDSVDEALVSHWNMFEDVNFNPTLNPTSYPYANTPLNTLYSRGNSPNQSRVPMPGQNAPHPLYAFPYCGGSNVNGAGTPGSVHITVDGVTTSFTTVGTHTFTIS